MTDKNAINKKCFYIWKRQKTKEMLRRSKEISNKPFKRMRTK